MAGVSGMARTLQARRPASASVSEVTIRRAAGTWFRQLTAEWQVRAALGIGLSGANAIGIAVVTVITLGGITLVVGGLSSYVAAQGTVLGRSGRVHVTREGDTLWVGGHTTTTVAGEVHLGG